MRSRVSSLLYVVMLLTKLASTLGEIVSGADESSDIADSSSSDKLDSAIAVSEMNALAVSQVAIFELAGRGVTGAGDADFWRQFFGRPFAG